MMSSLVHVELSSYDIYVISFEQVIEHFVSFS